MQISNCLKFYFVVVMTLVNCNCDSLAFSFSTFSVLLREAKAVTLDSRDDESW